MGVGPEIPGWACALMPLWVHGIKPNFPVSEFVYVFFLTVFKN